jgi:hypothetical protein
MRRPQFYQSRFDAEGKPRAPMPEKTKPSGNAFYLAEDQEAVFMQAIAEKEARSEKLVGHIMEPENRSRIPSEVRQAIYAAFGRAHEAKDYWLMRSALMHAADFEPSLTWDYPEGSPWQVMQERARQELSAIAQGNEFVAAYIHHIRRIG